jgi:hypothetical protein
MWEFGPGAHDWFWWLVTMGSGAIVGLVFAYWVG